MLERLLAHWKEDLPRVLTAAQTGSDRFRSALEATVSFFKTAPYRARLLCREMLDRPEEMTTLFAEHLQPWTSLITDYIRSGQQGHTRREVDPEAYIVQLLHAAIGIIATGGAARHVFRDPPSIERQLTELFRMAKVALFADRPPSADATSSSAAPPPPSPTASGERDG